MLKCWNSFGTPCVEILEAKRATHWYSRVDNADAQTSFGSTIFTEPLARWIRPVSVTFPVADSFCDRRAAIRYPSPPTLALLVSSALCPGQARVGSGFSARRSRVQVPSA